MPAIRIVLFFMCVTVPVNPTSIPTGLLERHLFRNETDSITSRESASFQQALAQSVDTNPVTLQSKAYVIVTDTTLTTQQNAPGLSVVDISNCIFTNSSLNLTVKEELTIVYFQHRRPLNPQNNTAFTTTFSSASSPFSSGPRSGPGPSVSRQDSLYNHDTGLCKVFIEVPVGKVLSILFLNQTCSRDNEVRIDDRHDNWGATLNGCSPWKSPGYDVTTAGWSAVMLIDVHNYVDFYKLKIHVAAVEASSDDDFFIRYVSPTLGYLQTPGWHPFTRPSYGITNGMAIIVVPVDHMTLINVVFIRMAVAYNAQIQLFTTEKREKKTQRMWTADAYNRRIRREISLLRDVTDFRIKLTLDAPQQDYHGLLNCSVPSWLDFRDHLVCNNRNECAGREDEMGCPDTTCQQGGMQIDGSCYFFHLLPEITKTWQHGKFACRKRGAALATFPTVNSWYHLALLLGTDGKGFFYIGLHSTDKSVSYIACWFEFDISSGDGYVTTDNTTICNRLEAVSFACKNGARWIPYSLVCNHFQDCVDASDETFCVFPQCSESSQYTCVNGQCIHIHQLCDSLVQCADDSDEADCPKLVFRSGDCSSKSVGCLFLSPRPPLLADYDGRGRAIYTPLRSDRDTGEIVCPHTHVFCPGDGYCFPVYVRCNGIYDCPGHEDEVGCDSYTCPGFYRCRGLINTCLHPNHLCDGVSQCPQHDDELFCNLTCPVNCTCLGYAFTCVNVFQVNHFLNLRYLDAGATGLVPERLVHNVMIVYLSLARCNLTHLGNMNMPNLLSLDVSDNRFSVVRVTELRLLKNLQNLSLARNPLSQMFIENVSSVFRAETNLHHLDVSSVDIKVLDVRSSFPFPRMVSINLTNSGLTRLIGDGFRSMTSLAILDLRGCPLTVFPSDVFVGLNGLRQVFADNYKLCCSAALPTGFKADKCHAPFNEVSSCEALLRSNVYRVCLSVLATLALCGNLGCFCLRVFALTGRGKTGFNVFVTHLCVSDFVMGVYLMMIGVADRMYMGRYLWEDGSWRHSTACQLTGVLALLSSEVSAFIICLITLDRFMVIRFPFSGLRFSPLSAHAVSFMTWTGGVILVTVPTLPVVSHWHLYGQTGICVPLPITKNNAAGDRYAFGVMILLNLVVFFLIAVGQISVYLSMTNTAMSSMDTSRRSRDLIVARRLITVVVSDFLCWFPLGLLGVLAMQGVPIPSEVNVVLAIFVLPLNSALNPFLYTLNMIQEKRRRATEIKLMKEIMDRGRKKGQQVTKNETKKENSNTCKKFTFLLGSD